MGKFLITEEEKSKILGMYYKNTGKKLVNEQDMPDDMWENYVNSLNKVTLKPGSLTISTPPNILSNEKINEYKAYDVAFFVEDSAGTTKQVQYQCIDAEPGIDVTFKAGQIFDGNQKLTNVASELDATGIPWRQMFTWACKPAMAVLAARKAKQQPQAQVAGATTAKPVAAPNPVSDAEVAAKQKISQQTKLNSQQAQQQLTDKMADANYLNPNKEKVELDKEALEVYSLINSASPISGDLLLSVKSRLNRLLKVKPEYKQEPYGLNPTTMF
jgi:hypothetical protein